jgi:geranylgeranyl diphosphate synthase type II
LNKDHQQGKATYPAILGEEASRRLAGELIDQACEALADFGESAVPLRELALFVRRRNN